MRQWVDRKYDYEVSVKFLRNCMIFSLFFEVRKKSRRDVATLTSSGSGMKINITRQITKCCTGSQFESSIFQNFYKIWNNAVQFSLNPKI